jgi:GWxTD domain-containing protein
VFSGVAVVPLGRVGIGPASLVFRRVDGAAGDTVRATIFVGFADDLPVASYEEMLNYLKYFPAPDRVTALRDVAPAGRAAAWVQFVRVTNPNPATPRNEALDNYIQRLRQANERYTGEGIPGWQTDRGMVFISIGEPDQSYAQGSLQGSARGREQVWVYHQYNAQLTFEDVKGFGRYTLARRSEAQFRALMKRIREKATAPAPASTSP